MILFLAEEESAAVQEITFQGCSNEEEEEKRNFFYFELFESLKNFKVKFRWIWSY